MKDKRRYGAQREELPAGKYGASLEVPRRDAAAVAATAYPPQTQPRELAGAQERARLAGQLAGATGVSGVLLSGDLPAAWTTYLNLTATGSAAILYHSKFRLNADGTAVFTGTITAGTLTSADAKFVIDLDNNYLTSSDGTYTRVKIGDFTGGVYGIQVRDASDNIILDTTGLGSDVVDTAQIVADAVTTAEILDNTIVAGNIAVGTITATEITGTSLSAIYADMGTLTAGLARDASSTFVADFTNALLTVTDTQGSPVARVLVGKLGEAAADYGIEVYDSSGTLILGATGLGTDVVGAVQIDSATDLTLNSLTTTAGVTVGSGLTVSAGTLAAQALTATTITASGDVTTSDSIISTGGGETGKFLTGLAGATVFAFSGPNFDIRAGTGSSSSQNVMRVTSAGAASFLSNSVSMGALTATTGTFGGLLKAGTANTYAALYGGNNPYLLLEDLAGTFTEWYIRNNNGTLWFDDDGGAQFKIFAGGAANFQSNSVSMGALTATTGGFSGNITAQADIFRGASNSNLDISGGSDGSTGARISLYGESHSSNALDFLFYTTGTVRLTWDNSASTWYFGSYAGTLPVQMGALTATMETVNGAAGTERIMRWTTAGTDRWRATASSHAESGSNVGTKFMLQAFTDGGGLLRNDLIILRDTGAWTIAGAVAISGLVSVDDTTDTSSGTTGSVHTDGGLGVAKALWVATTSRLVGNATFDAGILAAGDDQGAIGASGTAFSDLFLASGGVINFDSGDMLLTHSANTVTVSGGTFATAALTATTIGATGDVTLTTADLIFSNGQLIKSAATEVIQIDTAGITFHNAYQFPTGDGSKGEVLITDAAGNLDFGWITIGGADGDVVAANLADGTSVALVHDGRTPAGAGPSNPPAAPVLVAMYKSMMIDCSAYGALGGTEVFVIDYSVDGGGYTSDAIITTDPKVVHTGLAIDGTTYTYKYLVRAGADSDYSAATSATEAGSQSSAVVQGVVLASQMAVVDLASVSAALGVITTGFIRDTDSTAAIRFDGTSLAGYTTYIDLTADEAGEYFIKHPAFELEGDGSADFSGEVSAEVFSGTAAVFTNVLRVGTGNTHAHFGQAGVYLFKSADGELAFDITRVNDAYLRITDASFSTEIGLNASGDVTITDHLNISQGAADDDILTFLNTDVAHGMTTVVGTTVYGRFKKADIAAGALAVWGFGESTRGIELDGAAASGTTTKSTAAMAPVLVVAYKKSGTNITALGTDENLMAIRNAGTARFIFDAEGSGHSDVEWTTWQHHKDIELLEDFEAIMRPDIFGQPKERAGKRRNNKDFEDLELVHGRRKENGKERGMVNQTKLAMLSVGAIRQTYDEVAELKQQVVDIQERIAVLEAA